jgi:hypothetical protein
MSKDAKARPVNFADLKDALSYVRVLQKPIPNPKPLKAWKPRPRERIDGGSPTRTPVDRVAARVVAPAPWWAKPPVPKKGSPETSQPNTKKKHKKTTKMTTTKTKNPMLDGKFEDKTDHQLNVELTRSAVKNFAASVEDTETLVSRAKEATAAIDYIATHVKTSWLQCQDELKEALLELRNKKFAIENESKQLLLALRDIRQFFLDDRHEEEMRRLSDFVSLCERLKELKESGFMDAVADTILRMEDK